MRYKILGRRTGLKVSALCLGTGMFGRAWGYGAAPEEARSILQGYVEAGGNFIDTADNYQHGEAERLIGEIAAPYRNDLVIASKFSRGAGPAPALARLGNNRKAMVQAVEESLVRLKTDRIERGRATDLKASVLHDEPARHGPVLDALIAVADDLGASPGQVAIAWAAAKGVIPVVGPRTRAQLDENLGAAALALDDASLRRLDEVSAVSLGYPHELNRHAEQRAVMTGDRWEQIDFPERTVA